jgi:nuclear pore complex protein Nup107
MHDIQYGLNKGHIVTEVDPDCRSRQKKPLSELDEKDELSLSKHLFECIRAGELDKAQQLCIQCGQSWRAATFNGWKLYHDPNLYKDIGSDLDDVGGNPTRDLWKSSCWNLMKCATFGNYEKAIYAAMSGNLSCLLKVCNTWYDCLWSYYRVMVDVLVEKKLRTSNRYPSDYQFVQLPDEYWDAILTPEVIFQEIEANPSQNIKRQCLNYYHLTQKHIILGSLDDLIDEMYFWLKEKQSTNGHIMRFMAHIALFIRSISSTYNEEKCNSILESFIMMLISNQLNDLVPLYCSYLPHELQLKCYCNFLSGITEPKEQKKCLELAAQNGLDLTSITKGVVEKLRNMEIVEEGNIQLTADGDGISQNDWNRINSLDWLLYKTSDRHEAIYQANALIRLFIIADKHPAAVAVYERIPDDSINVIKQNWMIENGEVPYSAKFNDDLHEWLCIKVYLEAIGLFNDWFHEFHHSKPILPTSSLGENFKEKIALERREEEYKELVIQWEKRIDFMTKEVVKKMYNVLLFVKGWMVDDGDKSSVRSRQMKKLRQICIPKICFLLHSVHHSTGKYSQCLRLVDVITSEFNCLYKEFSREELTQLIHCLSQSAIEQSASLKLDSFGYSST